MYIDLWPDGCECLPDVMDVIELDGLCPVFFSAADCSGSELWNNSLVFRKGRAYLVEAASGKGKSSFCSFVCGIRHDYTGHVLFDGRDIRTFAQTEWRDMRRSSFGMMFQDLELFPELTVTENLDIKNRLTGYYSFSEMDDLLCRLGLSGKSGQKVSTLSLGERQRVAFIRTLAQPLDFLLMDELHRCGIPADTDLCGRGLKAQMKYADKIGAKFTMVLGDNELQEGKAEMKNMKTGEKRKIAISGEDFINDYVTVSTEAEDFSQDGIFF